MHTLTQCLERSPETLIDLAQAAGVSLPLAAESPSELAIAIYRECCGSLDQCLSWFRHTVAVMQSGDALERIAYELAYDSFSENVFYIEVRFAPQLHAGPAMDIEAVLRRVNAGLARAKAEFNARGSVLSGATPAYNYGIIVCGLRFFTEHFSSYYASFIHQNHTSNTRQLYGMATVALVKVGLAP